MDGDKTNALNVPRNILEQSGTHSLQQFGYSLKR